MRMRAGRQQVCVLAYPASLLGQTDAQTDVHDGRTPSDHSGVLRHARRKQESIVLPTPSNQPFHFSSGYFIELCFFPMVMVILGVPFVFSHHTDPAFEFRRYHVCWGKMAMSPHNITRRRISCLMFSLQTHIQMPNSNCPKDPIPLAILLCCYPPLRYTNTG